MMNPNLPARRMAAEIDAPERAVVEWEQSQNGVNKRVADGVYLGVLVDCEGWNAGYVDQYEEPLVDCGFVAGVSQASYGYTGTYAKALPGYKIAAVTVDEQTGSTSWVEQGDDSKVTIASDRGNLSTTSIDAMDPDFNFGNPGARVGVVRVTSPEGEEAYYMVGALFDGKPDGWQATAEVVQVQPMYPPELSHTALELPVAE